MSSAYEDARVPLVEPEHVTGDTRELFDRFARERGKVPNLFRAAAASPAIVQTLRAHMDAVMGPGTVPVQLKELVSVRVSHLNHCEY